MLQLETVLIEHPDIPGESMIINKSDFDPKVHTLHEPPKNAVKVEKDTDGANDDGKDGETDPAPQPKAKAKKKAE